MDSGPAPQVGNCRPKAHPGMTKGNSVRNTPVRSHRQGRRHHRLEPRDFSLCRSLAGEWGPKGVRVNCVAPGLVKTDFAKALWEDEERLRRRCATTPLRRIGEPDEIAGAVAYLGSDATSFMTGQTIVVDGGVTTASV
jgi:hypothetical protein